MKAKKNRISKIDFFPLQKIEIIESTKVYKPGSIGYVCWVGNLGTSLIQSIRVIFMRYGKKGKLRATETDVLYSCLDLSNWDKERTNILRKQIYYPSQRIVVISPAVQETKDLRELSEIEFLCYISAFSSYIDHLQGVHIYRKLAPRYDLASLYDHIRHLPNFTECALHTFITKASDIPEKLVENPEAHPFFQFQRFFKSRENRQFCMEKLYKSLAALKNAVNQYHKDQDAIRNNVKYHIEKLLNAYGENKKEESAAEKARPKQQLVAHRRA
jgi:hypothetical protein